MSNSLNVNRIEIPGQQSHGESVFPFAYRCESPDATVVEAAEWITAHRDELLQLAATHGAVLYRDFPTPTAEEFDAMIVALGVENFPYRRSLSNAVRVNVTDRVFSANEAPPDVHIFFHHEMAQTPIFPHQILFHCEVAPDEGGATPICRSDVLFERLKAECPDFVAACESKGLKYSNVMPGENDANSGMGRSWRSTLGVDDRAGAEARLRELGYSWEWVDDGCLRATTPALPAVMDVGNGRKAFFNQLIAAYKGWKDSRNDPSSAIRHGDGDILDANAVAVAIRLADELAFDVQWQVGDFALIDNTVAMHARRPFVGQRKVRASLAAMQTQSFTVTA